MSNPGDVGDNGNALPAQEMLHPDDEILPYGAGVHARELRRDLVVKPHLVVPLQRGRHRGHQHIVIILAGHAALASDCDDIRRETARYPDHGLAPFLPAVWNARQARAGFR